MITKKLNKSEIFLPFTLILFIIIFSVFPNFAEAKNNNLNWHSTKKSNGIEVFLRNTKNSPLKAFKGVVTVNSKLSSIMAVLDDTDGYPKWLFNCKSAKTINKSSNSITNHIVTKMPWPVKNRDTVLFNSTAQDSVSKNIEIKIMAKPRLLPNKAGVVRIENMQGRWLLRPVAAGKVNIIYEMNVDPGGSIPKWLVNSLTVDHPFNTLKNMREVLKEAKYVNASFEGIID